MKPTDRKRQAIEVLKRLKKEYPEPRTELRFGKPFELLAATILSAQSTDAGVNRVTEKLFKKYRSVQDFAGAPLEELQKDVSSINFYRNKAKNIKASAQMIMEKFGGKVPDTMEELISLPGVARKTANIVLANAYGKNEGIAVDTHVARLSLRLGLTDRKEPSKIEKDLMELVPREEWSNFSHLLIFHGRRVCLARKPKHSECVLFDICPSRDI
jgi:endonuclease-3